MTEEELLKYVTITDDKVIFDKNFYEDIMIPCMKNTINKKILIYFLEDKIKNITNYAISFGLTIDKDISHEIDIKKNIYQEVLDYVKGDIK